MIDQVSVFLENSPGQLSQMCASLAVANINMKALYIAENSDYGIIRILCDTPHAAVAALRADGWQARTTAVYAVKIPDEPGGLGRLLSVLDSANINIEYAYCFSTKENVAIDVLKLGIDTAEPMLMAAGFVRVAPEDIYLPD